jgi:hypothetical protein
LARPQTDQELSTLQLLLLLLKVVVSVVLEQLVVMLGELTGPSESEHAKADASVLMKQVAYSSFVDAGVDADVE